ncbi:hypothetical protein HDU86_002872 [Geranomyces michiganensis]|nr:hypothetical protein HDU86_002872 [Geranomyces michiganensis]
MYAHSALLTLALAGGVLGHGMISSPTPRLPGPAMQAACGQTIFNTQNSDTGGNIQDLLNKRGPDFDPVKCNLWLCKGYQLADNLEKVQKYAPGQVVPIAFDIRAPHSGTANASIVDLETNTVIGKELIYFADFASTRHVIPDSNRNFDVTIPDLGGKCAAVGSCAIQFYWDSREAGQTYESCIDFTQTGGGASPAPKPAPPTTKHTPPAVTTTPAAPPNPPTPVMTSVPSPTSIDCEPNEETTAPAAPPAATVAPAPAPPSPPTAGRDCNVLVPKCWAEQKQCWADAQALIAAQGWNAAAQAAQAACGKKGEECNNLNCSWTRRRRSRF